MWFSLVSGEWDGMVSITKLPVDVPEINTGPQRSGNNAMVARLGMYLYIGPYEDTVLSRVLFGRGYIIIYYARERG